MARRSEGKRGKRSKATQTSVFEQQRSQTEKIKAKGFAKDFFRRARRDEEKRGRRSKATRTNFSRNGEAIREKYEAKCSLKTTQKKK